MNIRIHIGDCREALDMYEDNYFGVVCTSPPYYTASTDYYPCLESWIKEMKECFQKIYRKLMYGRICAVNISDITSGYSGERLPLGWYILDILLKTGFKYQETIIWVKPTGAGAKSKTGAYGKRAGLVIQKQLPLYYYPDDRKEYIFIVSKGALKRRSDYNRKIDVLGKFKKYLSSIWEMPTVSSFNRHLKFKHPIAFPLQLPLNVLNFYGYRDEAVLDPFLGGGTTILAAMKLGFNEAVGVERSRRWLPGIMLNIYGDEVSKPGIYTRFDVRIEVIEHASARD